MKEANKNKRLRETGIFFEKGWTNKETFDIMGNADVPI